MVQDIAPWKVLTRRKNLQVDGTEGETKLNRVLGLWDLTALGVGSTLGAGVYVLAGQIAKEQAGPSVMISFAIAALASLLAGICYAEFGARVPKAGSAYIYSYVCIGEFVAFVIGWNLILEYVIGTAAVCRGISLYLDSLINDTLKTTFEEIAPMDVNILGDYFDFFAFLLVMVFGIALAFGVQTSTMLNNFVTCLNIFILGFVVVAGAVKADFSNWTIDVSQVTTNVTDIGQGGYFPYGFQGTLQGAATCFFGFVGFDCIATTGEEVQNPRKNIPTSILLSLLIIFLSYFGISTVLTLMLPYYQQDANAPLPYAFEHIGWPVAMWIVTIGGLIGLLASLFGALFPLPRVIYSMAQDGLLFRSWGKISPKYRVPVKGSIVAAIFTAFIAGFFDLAQLVSLLSIGTLLAYSVVAISITILRYMEYSESFSVPRQKPSTETTSLTTMRSHRFTWGGVFKQLFNLNRLEEPNLISTRIVGVLATLFCLLSLGVGLIITLAMPSIKELQAWALTLLILFAVLICVVLVLICLQPREPRSGLFRVPFVPLVPAISIFINIYLMLQLDSWTWIRFGVWMIVGIPTYIACWFLYDAKNPRERNPERIAYYKELKLNFDPPNKGTSEQSVLTQSTSIKRSPTSSLDQIHTLSEIGDDLIEIRQHSSNGKLFYVEETKNDENSTVMSNGSVGLGGEDERSVIAMLDDVLEAEDNAQHEHIFERNFSLDSEMYPCVIETTIVATVHNSSSDEELTTTNNNNNNNNNDNNVKSFQLNRYEEYQIVAKEMLEEMFNSVAFYQQLEMARVVKFEVKESSNELKRIESGDSIVDDPLHSENFKNRLSNLILNASGQAAAVAAAKINNKKIDEPEANKPEVRQLRPPLKQSKSETDLRQLMLKAINELKTHDNEKASASTSAATAAVAAGIVTADSNVKASTSVAVATATATTSYHIPRAPKFDPVLYKTINSISLHKQRPTFSKELVVDARNLEVAAAAAATTTAGKEEPSSPELELESLPFKAKLEAILRRGPSHPTQRQRPGANIRRRPQSTHIEEMAVGETGDPNNK